jgi:hypothetical protein
MHAAWLLAPAAAGVCLTYLDSLSRGLYWDDYYALRPWTRADIWSAFHGSWDPAGLWPVYLRPLTIAYYALGFQLFGLNAWALHAVSLVEIALAAWMTATLALRERVSPALAALAALLYASHPAIVYAQGPWFFLQNHLLCTLAVLAALLVWQRRRARPSVWHWWPIWTLTIAGFLIQEDLVMLAPAVVAAHAARASLMRDVPRPRWTLFAIAVGLPAALFLLRLFLLGQLGGRDVPSAAGFLLNALRMVGRVLFVFQRQQQPITLAASLVSSGTLLAGAWLAMSWRRTRPDAAAPAVALGTLGLAVFGCFGLPLLLLSSPSRYHLIGLAGVLLLTAALHLVGAWMEATLGAAARPGVLAVALLSMVLAGREALAPLRPCGSEMLMADADVEDWAPVPAPVRAWLTRKPAACRAGAYQPLTTAGLSIAWRSLIADRTVAVVLVPRADDSATIALQSQTASPESPLSFRVTADGHDIGRLTLTSPGWHWLAVPLGASLWTTLRRMHRIDVTSLNGPLAPGAVDLRLASGERDR